MAKTLSIAEEAAALGAVRSNRPYRSTLDVEQNGKLDEIIEWWLANPDARPEKSDWLMMVGRRLGAGAPSESTWDRLLNTYKQANKQAKHG